MAALPSRSASPCRSSARSSRSRPASSGCRSGAFLPLAALGSAVFAFALAGGGWALGDSYQSFRDAFKYVDVLVAAAVVVLAVYLFVRWRRQRSTTIRSSANGFHSLT